METANTTTEIWKDIKGYEGLYQISNFGNVMSLERVVKSINRKDYTLSKKLLKNSISGNHYAAVGLSRCGQAKTTEIHRIVATAFISNPDKHETVDHIDGNKYNNNVKNLRWISRSKNTSLAHERNPRTGSSHPLSKLTEKDVFHIRDELDKKFGTKKMVATIAKGYGVSRATINDIKNMKKWTHI